MKRPFNYGRDCYNHPIRQPRTTREYGHAYAAWGHGEGIEGFSRPVDLDMYPEIPDSDCREMQEAGIALEILFEDGSPEPYSIHVGTEQVDRMPLDSNCDRKGQPPRWRFAVWTSAGKVLELPCRYRVVKRLPWMKKF